MRAHSQVPASAPGALPVPLSAAVPVEIEWSPPSLGWPTATCTIVDLIGNTPLFPLGDFVAGKPRVSVLAKLEHTNPGGSIKDRPAALMIHDGLARGALTPGKHILDSTSGNTGIALAMIGRALGYPVTLCMSAGVTEERKRNLRALGAELVLTDPALGSDGAIVKAQQLFEGAPDRYFMTDQYANPANMWAHYLTTAPELWAQTAGRLTHVVVPVGTSGTLMGVGRRLLEFNPRITVVAVEPDSAEHGLWGMRHLPSTMRPRIYRSDGFHRLVRVSTAAAHEMARTLGQRYGLLLGASSAAALVAAGAVAAELEEGVVAAICPDGAGRYLSTEMFGRENSM